MSLLKHIEENVEHLYALVKHIADGQLAAHGHIVPETKALLAKLEEHLDVAQPAAPVIEAPVVISAPVVASVAPTLTTTDIATLSTTAPATLTTTSA